MPELMNPYTAGDPVGKTGAFVGREDVLRDVLRVLRHPTQNALTLYGQRRIGKTSILQYLDAHLPEEGPYYPVHFDLMGKAGAPLGDILRDLARTIAFNLDLPDPDLGRTPEGAFRETFLPAALRALPEGASLVLLLDEFDVLTDPQAEQQAKRTFFGYVRHLRSHDPAHMQFVFVLGRNLDDLDIVAQGLFKDLPSTRVSLLEREDADALVRLSERDGGLDWSEVAMARVWALTAGHPYLTQALCSEIWEETYDAFDVEDAPPAVTPEAVEAAITGALQRSENMFAWLWEGLGPAEKVVAAALAGAGPVVVDAERLRTILAESGVRILIGELRDAPRVLQEWDILAPADGGYCFRVELLRRWIETNKPLARTQEELDHINPVANSLFEAARGFYLSNNLAQVEPLLHQTLGLNPNHIRANELLAEILLANGALDEAQTVLEKLEELAPGRARPRLKQVYLQRAEAAPDDAEKLTWYERILDLFPDDPQAGEARRAIYRARGERALQAEEFEQARKAFQAIGETDKVQEIADLLRRRDLEAELVELARLEDQKAYPQAYEYAQALAERYIADRDWVPDLARLQAKAQLDTKYQQALVALERGDFERAKQGLAEVIALDPEYEQATRYLHKVVTGEDPRLLQADIELLKEQLAHLQENLKASGAKAEGPKEPIAHPKGSLEAARAKPDGPTNSTKEILQPPSDPDVDQPDARPLRRLSPWHPLDYIRLLWWTLVMPDRLKAYRSAYGKRAAEPVGSRLAYALTHWFWLMPLLGLGLGLMPRGVYNWQSSMLLWMALGVAVIWAGMVVLADVLDDTDDWVGIVASGVEFIATLGVGFIVAFGVAGDVAGGIAFVVAFVVAGGVEFAVIYGVAGHMAGSVGLGSAFSIAASLAIFVAGGRALEIGLYTFIFVIFVGLVLDEDFVFWLVGGVVVGLISAGLARLLSGYWAADTFLQSVISIISGGMVFGVTLGMFVAIDNDKHSRWAFALLALSWLTLAFLSFGGLTWLQTGAWPTPVWPFGADTPAAFLVPLFPGGRL